MALLEFLTFCGKHQDQQLCYRTLNQSPIFFETKAIPPSLWNACDYVLHFKFKIAHITSSVNITAGFVSRLELKVTENIRLKIRLNIQGTPIKVPTSSSKVTYGKQFFCTKADNDSESGEQTLERKEQSRQNTKQRVVNEEPLSLETGVKEFIKIDGNRTAYSIIEIKAIARIRVEHNFDLVLQNLKLKIFGQPHDEVILTTDRRLEHYKANEDRLILKEGLLFQKYYGEIGSVKNYQILIPK